MSQKYDNTNVEYLHLGGSYPSSEVDKQSRELFKNVNTQYLGVEGDIVYEGMPILRNLGVGMIGNNPNAVPNRVKTSILKAHSEANQNINNLKFIYKLKDNGEKNEKWLNTEDILKHTYPEGIRKFNEINKDR